MAHFRISRAGIIAVMLSMAWAAALQSSAIAAGSDATPLPPPADAPVLPPARSDDPPLPQPPADVRPPLPLPGESGRLERQASSACSATDETACGAVPSCAWVKVYGTVPGQPTAGFCHPRAAIPSDAGPGR